MLAVSAFFASHRGGVELVAEAQARALTRQGCEVRLLACDVSSPPADGQDGPLFESLPASNFTERFFNFPWPTPGMWRRADDYGAGRSK